jgi:hypothetical protein
VEIPRQLDSTLNAAGRHSCAPKEELFEAGDAPFDFDLVSIKDIEGFIPERTKARSGRLAYDIGEFLRSMGAASMPGRTRPRLWALRDATEVVGGHRA